MVDGPYRVVAKSEALVVRKPEVALARRVENAFHWRLAGWGALTILCGVLGDLAGAAANAACVPVVLALVVEGYLASRRRTTAIDRFAALPFGVTHDGGRRKPLDGATWVERVSVRFVRAPDEGAEPLVRAALAIAHANTANLDGDTLVIAPARHMVGWPGLSDLLESWGRRAHASNPIAAVDVGWISGPTRYGE